MPIRVRTKTTGGGKLRARLREDARRMRQLPKSIEVGFKGNRFIVLLAAKLEFGDSGANLPERPAFRIGARAVQRELRKRIGKIGTKMTGDKARELALWARDEIRGSYLRFHGPGLSTRQAARKQGTRYADDELVGPSGPKLIGYIDAFVDGVQVE